ncbi:hypothetical protein [Nocardioides sp. YIM 152588]|uniref:hypothetical protein n=1 Tax=Nocardioides sp. YIM 152588 TaxID=3158259 RepID=UPI0032E3E8C9
MSAPRQARAAQRVHAREQVAAALRDAGRPLLIGEIRDRIGGYMSYLEWTLGTIRPGDPRHARGDVWHQCGEGGCFKSSEHGAVCDGDLRALQKAGDVAKIKDGRRVRWLWIGGEQVGMAEFEAALSES